MIISEPSLEYQEQPEVTQRNMWRIWNVVAADGWNLLLQQQLLYCVRGVTRCLSLCRIISFLQISGLFH